MNKIFSRSTKSLGLAGAIVTISDILQPIAPFAAYVMAVSVISLVILGLIALITKFWNESFAVSAYFASGLFILSSVLFFLQAQNDARSSQGYLASEIPEFQKLQRSLGFIEEKPVSIDKSVSSIDYKMDNVKKEVSANPRKELSNLGVQWSRESFLEALYGNDLTVVKFFLEGDYNVKPGFFKHYIDNYFTYKVASLFLNKEGLIERLCPKNPDFYADITVDSKKHNFIAKACSIPPVQDSLAQQISAENTKLATNSKVEGKRQKCITELTDIPISTYLNDYT
jgi:hypothetical protein